MRCSKCGHRQIFDFLVCPKCGFDLNANINEQIKSISASNDEKSKISFEKSAGISDQRPRTFDQDDGSGAISILKLFGLLDLFAGIIGAIIIWSSYATKKINSGEYYRYTETVNDPIAIGFGVAVLIQGIFVYVLFKVIASIAENVIVICKNTESK